MKFLLVILMLLIEHRLQGYNNDPDTTYEDINNLLNKLEDRIKLKLRNQN